VLKVLVLVKPVQRLFEGFIHYLKKPHKTTMKNTHKKMTFPPVPPKNPGSNPNKINQTKKQPCGKNSYERS